jgi:hypothetical protein
MKKAGLNIFTYLTIAVMLMSILSVGALAASDNGMNGNGEASDNSDDSASVADDDNDDDDDDAPGIQQQDRDRDMIHADEDAVRNQSQNKTRDKIQQAKDARANYMQAKDDFAKVKANNKALDSEEALQVTKKYLNASIDHMTGLIENNEKIDAKYIDELNEEKAQLEEASTRKELAESARDINKIWKEARKEQVQTATQTINNRMGSMLQTSNSVAVRLENEIQRMKNNGEDVEDIEEMLAEYKGLIAKADGNYEQARNNFRKGDAEYGETLRYMNDAGQNVNQANLVLKNMIQEIKEYREGVVLLNGTDSLEAEGEGTAVISGNISMELTASNAKLVIKDMAGDAAINTDDANYDSSNMDVGNSEDNNRAFVYHNITGNVTIEGSRLTVMLRGDEISLTAEGTGSVVLAGDGSYTVTKDGEITDGEWAERQYDEDESEDDESEDDESEDDESESETEDGNESESGNNS